MTNKTKQVDFPDYVTTSDTMWTASQLCDYAKQNEVLFNNVVQRNSVWNIKQKSLLIHSLIVNLMPPEFLANKIDGKYDMIDGKQRHNAISTFVDNEYKLVDIPIVVDSDGNEHDFNGKKFEELPVKIQEKIKGRGLKVSIIDNASETIIKEYFYRRNNGTSLSTARKTFVMAKSFDEINKLSKHPIFDLILSKKSKNSDENKNLVMKSYAILFNENKSLENKKIFAEMKRVKFTEEQIKIIIDCYDTLIGIYNILKEEDLKSNKKIMKRMMTKTHMISLLPLIKNVNDDNHSHEVFARWLCHFYGSDIGATINDGYNETCKGGSAKLAAVETRLKAVTDDYNEFIKENEK